MNVTIPAVFSVYIPKLDTDLEVSTVGVTEEQILAMIVTGLHHKLNDAAAGKAGEEAIEPVSKKLKVVWDASGSRGPKADPILVETRKIVLDNADKLKLVKKTIPAKMAEFGVWYKDLSLPEKVRSAIDTKAAAIVATRGEAITLD